jgi:Zn-finger nucleic acid-binding protein
MDEKRQCPKCGIWLRRGETHSCRSKGHSSPFTLPDIAELISKTLQKNQKVFNQDGCNVLGEVICEELEKAKFLKD